MTEYARVAKLSRTGKRYWVKLYGVWNAMRGRCNSPGTKDYKRYGARGIRVCPEWDDYGVFRAWALSHGFRKGLTLDREDSNGNYEPNNCRWVTKADQQLNTRAALRLTVNGVTRTLPEWSRICGIATHLIRSRVVYGGWDHKSAVTIMPGTLPRGRGMGLKAFLSSEDSAR